MQNVIQDQSSKTKLTAQGKSRRLLIKPHVITNVKPNGSKFFCWKFPFNKGSQPGQKETNYPARKDKISLPITILLTSSSFFLFARYLIWSNSVGFVSAKTLIVKLFERPCTSVRCVARFSFDFLFNLRHFLAIFLWPVWLNLTYSGLGRKMSFSCTSQESKRCGATRAVYLQAVQV